MTLVAIHFSNYHTSDIPTTLAAIAFHWLSINLTFISHKHVKATHYRHLFFIYFFSTCFGPLWPDMDFMSQYVNYLHMTSNYHQLSSLYNKCTLCFLPSRHSNNNLLSFQVLRIWMCQKQRLCWYLYLNLQTHNYPTDLILVMVSPVRSLPTMKCWTV